MHLMTTEPMFKCPRCGGDSFLVSGGGLLFCGSSHLCGWRGTVDEKPRMIPLGPQDVPPGSVVRTKTDEDKHGWWMIVATDRNHVYLGEMSEPQTKFWSDLQKEYVILRPGSDVWQPCEKPA